MPDNLTPEQRSYCMSRIRSRGNTATENKLIKIFRKHHITSWRRQSNVFGKPDFVFRKQRVAVFADGCFWHGCPKHSSQPTSNHMFWENKLARNKDRDRLVTRTLRKNGWNVLRIWQHELTQKLESRCVKRVRRALGALKQEGTNAPGTISI